MIVEKRLSDQSGEGRIEIDLENNRLTGEQFSYSLFVNGKLFDTKKISFVRE